MRDTFQYDSREVLSTRGPHHVERTIGVLVSTPFWHYGLKAHHVEVSRDTVTVSSVTYGNSYPADDAPKLTRAATEDTIAELDTVIAELISHRQRLAGELEKIDDRTWTVALAKA